MKLDVKKLFPNSEVVVILGSAGAGKTHHLINKIAEELKTTLPSRVALVTFTKKGVEEMLSRVLKVNPAFSSEDFDYCRTWHSLCFHSLHVDTKKIWGVQYEKILNKAIGSDVHRKYAADHATTDNKLLDQYDLLRAGGKVDQDLISTDQYKRLVAAYEMVKTRTGALDFTDCLTKFVEQGTPVPVDIAGIDEAQDMSVLQWQVAAVALRNCKRIYIAGDDYQAIFSYAGASPDILIELSKQYTCEKLEVSHRIPMAVYRLAKGITSSLMVKMDKDYVPETAREGEVEFLNDIDALRRYVREKSDESWYFLTRNTSFQQQIECMLKQESIPYTLNNSFVIPRRAMKVISKYYKFRKEGYLGTDERVRFQEEYGVTDFDEDIVDAGIFSPSDAAVYQGYIDTVGVERLEELSKGKAQILISNIHRVKGGEADNVAVFLDCGRKVAKTIEEDSDAELRTLYVAVTRAKKSLYLISAHKGYALEDLLHQCMKGGYDACLKS